MKKKFVQIAILALFLAGCSGLPSFNIPQLLASATAPLPVETPTPAPSQTPIPTQNMFATSTATPLTFTPTVTSIGAELFTPTTRATDFPTPGLPPPAMRGNYFTPQDTGFLMIMYSGSVLYWNEGPCMPRNVKISVFVEDLINTDKVLLFMRLRDKKNTLDITDWGAGAEMIKADNGSFNYDIRTFNIHRFYFYKEAWLEYQLVAYNKDMQEIGRSKVYDRNITLSRCLPVR